MPWTLLFVGLLVAGILAGVFFVLRKRTRPANGKQAAAAPPKARDSSEPGSEKWSPPSLKRSFRQGLQLLKQHVAGKDYRYQIPWVCVLGQTGSRRADLLANAGLHLPYGLPEEEGLASNTSCNWWFLDRGLLLDLGGEYVLRSDGKTWNESGWKTFINLLQRVRPRRPLDGVMLTIPCTDLLWAHESADVRSALEQKANLLHNRLWDLQNRAELRFPVYVVVTGCHQVPGFRSFAEAMPARYQTEMFGWSSPYNLDAAYQSSWLDEAFSSLGRRIDEARLKICAGNIDVRAAEQIVLFSGNFARLKEALRVYLSGLFKQTVYHESMFFRGIYFSGGGELSELELRHAFSPEGRDVETALSNATESRFTLFVKDLVERKVFAESSLARPTARKLVSKNRRVRLAKWATAAGALFLLAGGWRAYSRLDRRAPPLEEFLERVATDIRDIDGRASASRGNEATQSDPAEMVQRAERLLQMVATTDFSWFGSFFIPSSWFGSFNSDLTESIVESFDKILLPAMYRGLNQKAVDWITRETAADENSPSNRVSGNVQVTPIEQMEEFVALRRYVDGLMELERNGDRYNRLKDSRDLESLSQAVNYVFETPMPPGFAEKGDLYRLALERATYDIFQPEGYRTAAIDKARELAERFYHALFLENDLVRSLQEWNTVVPRLETSQLAGDEDAARTLETFLEVIAQTERARSQPELRWAFRGAFDLGPEFNQLLVDISDSKFLGDDLRREVRAETQNEWQQLQRFLNDFSSRYTPEEQAALESFLKEEFMRRNGTRYFVTHFLDGQWINWSDDALVRAAAFREMYENFLATRLEGFPSELRTPVDIVARNRVGANVGDLIADAQTLVPHSHSAVARLQIPALRETIQNFGSAAPHLKQLVDLFRDLNQRGSANDLALLAEQQGDHLLADIDDLLDEEALYTPRNATLSWWKGTTPVALEAFAVPDETALVSYLTAQRNRIRQLATELAQPVVTSMTWSQESPSFSRWEGILTELADYDNQKPGNQLASLESFISKDLEGVRLTNCFELVNGSRYSASGDSYFGRKKRDLERQLFETCRQLARGGALAGYQEMERFFNERLAGKFPFSDPSIRRDLAPSAPEDIRAFYQLFDRYRQFVEEMPEDNAAFQGNGRAVHEFISQMADVRGFFRGFLESTEPSPVLAFDVDADFRVNRPRESGGDQIMTWELRVGKDRVRNGTQARSARWTVGDRARLLLRWAKDAPRAPFAQPFGPAGSWEARTVAFEYTSPWSLVELLQQHLASDLEIADRRDSQPHVLKFVIPTRPVDDSGRPGPPSLGEDAVVYIRVRLKPALPVTPQAEGPAPAPTPTPEYVTLPAKFPERAPRLSSGATDS